ncbi:hypothetical protein PC116_g9057 [Phytophthora cactorum]|uniref:Uncharacterized protein n=1 Tax=Phytophthora cactorum TaxID=29920 RepID=A0A329RWN3_9STRA|nr:hypothetical protein PC111_g21215 [Phytophthora cactorum]KAG2816917.1 hypothetical protein PC112_g13274 [Phytophthora cactorum]KAG2836606.1 hypothetical protein PC113_g20001 [Phytophthora cactorum]KAG2876885.1 hypothetical protein PC114_g23956 [Phytophthora cactorum]KAG2893261.1 hypothetical protein PC117_g23821 [Phytophthora cactorum]
MVSQWCWILTDGFSVLGCSYVITLSKPLKELKPFRPTSSLIGPTTLVSLFGQQVVNVVFLCCIVRLLTSEVWYCPFLPENIDAARWWIMSDNHLSTLFFFTIIFRAVMDQFRISSSTNVVGLPDIPMPFSFRLKYFGLVLGHIFVSVFFQHFVVLGPVRSHFRKKYHTDAILMRK